MLAFDTKWAIWSVFSVLPLLVGCGGDENPNTSSGGTNSEPIAAEISFEARVGSNIFDCASIYKVGSAQSDATITDFRLYVHGVKLHATDGSWATVELDQDGLFQYQNIALLDFENKAGNCMNGTTETNTTIRGKVAAGTYDGISFVVGVPFDLNHEDAAVAPSPLNLSALFWSWNGGYKFMRVDAKAMGAMGSFNMHLGSTGCMDDGMGHVMSCAQPNRPTIDLTGFDPLTGKIVINYGALVAENDISTDTGGAPGCMSGIDDPECVATFGKLGIHIADGSIHPEEQVVFQGE